jgi:predicted DCC family thiol-disulfide oxidoreductase YuxK
VERAVLIYDGECAACRTSALLLMRRALSHDRLQILPYRSGPRRQRYPGITEQGCRRAMHLVLADGRVLAGPAAVPELLRRLPGWRWFVALVDLRAGAVSRSICTWLAEHRLGICCRAAGA